jgi:hypothetical protein
MTYLYYWFASGAAGLALDVFFALLGFGYVHRSMQRVKIPNLPKKYVFAVFVVGVVVGSTSSMLLGPIRIAFALAMARRDRLGKWK